jgi:hypothetical protein
LDIDLQKKFMLFVSLIVTIKLYGVTILTLEFHNPPRNLAFLSNIKQVGTMNLTSNLKNMKKPVLGGTS